MTPETECKMIPLLGENASKKQMIQVINENTMSVNMMIGILGKMTLILDDLTKRVMAAEEKED